MPREENFDRPLPSSPDTERAILGSILLDNALFDEAATLLRLEDFHTPSHREIFAVMIELQKEQIPQDVIVIADRLKALGRDRGASMLLLSSLTDKLPHVSNLKPYINILKEKSNLRWAIKEGERIMSAGYNEEEAQTIFAAATDRFSGMREQTVNGHRGGLLSEIASEVVDHLWAVRAGVNTAIATGLHDLDRLSKGGIRPGEMWGIAARSSRGKSSILVQILLNMAKRGVPAVLISLETRELPIMLRILAAESGVSMNSLRAPGELRDGEIDELIRRVKEEFNLPLWIFTKGYKSVGEIKRKVRALNKTQKIQVVGIDWYGKLSGYGAGRDRYENRTQELKYVADFLQQEIAIGEDVGLLVPAQFNRSGWSASEPGPQNIDGGEAYHDACDLFAVLHTETTIVEQGGKQMSKAKLSVYKQRNGPIALGKDALKLMFDRHRMQFFPRIEDAGEEVPASWRAPAEPEPVSPAGLQFDERERKDFL